MDNQWVLANIKKRDSIIDYHRIVTIEKNVKLIRHCSFIFLNIKLIIIKSSIRYVSIQTSKNSILNAFYYKDEQDKGQDSHLSITSSHDLNDD